MAIFRANRETAAPARGGATGVPAWIARARGRLAFGWKARARTWRLLAHLVRPRAEIPALELPRALERVAAVEALTGAAVRAHVLRDLAEAARMGRFADRVRHWSAGPEAVLFQALGRTARVDRLFDGAALIAESEGRIATAVRGALIGPALMGLALVVLLAVLGTGLFPQLAELVPIGNWSPASRLLYGVGAALAAAGLWLVPVPIVLRAGLGLAQRRWTGRGRVQADLVPPFSFMALRTGAAFLLVIAEQARMGQEMTPARFRALAAEAATPYERDRIGAVARALERADNPGRAALLAGKRWPGVEMCAVLDAFAGQGAWAEPFRAFVVDWIRGVGPRVEAQARIVTFVLMAAITGVAAAVILAVFDVAAQIGP